MPQYAARAAADVECGLIFTRCWGMRQKYVVPAAVLMISLLMATWLVLQEEPALINQTTPPTMLVDVVRAQKSSATITVSAQGTAIPRTQTLVMSEVSGLIVAVSEAFVAGGFFKKGDVLVRIDDRNYQAEVKRAVAAVAAAETTVARETGLADYAKEDWERSKSVLSSSKAATELALRKPQMAEAFASLEFARADLEKRESDLDRTVIKAPYDGLVREKRADLGQFVNAGTPLASTFSVDVAEIRLPLPDRELPFLNLDEHQLRMGLGPRVELTAVIGGSLRAWQGKLVRTEGVFDERSRVLYVVAEVRDPYNQRASIWPQPLRVGTFVQAMIAGESLSDVIRLPRSVLRGDSTVWTVTAKNTLMPATVNVVRADERDILISSGLEAGQLVCTSLLDNPLTGTPVRYERIDETTFGMNVQTTDL